MSQVASRAIACIGVLLLLVGAFAPEARAAEGRKLVLGRISSEPRKHIDRLRAMADYLALRLADHGISGAEIVIVDNIAAMRELFSQGKVDLISETAFTALDLSVNGPARPLLREWKKGVAQYHSVVVVRKDSGIDRLEDLRDKKFAFEDSGSTSGYFLPRGALENAGLSLVPLGDPRESPPKGALGYSFAGGEINVIAWVNRGLADAGAISNLDWEDPESAPALLRNDLKILYETRPVIRSVMLVRRSLEPSLVQEIEAILLDMDQSDGGRAVLKKYFKVSRYDRVEGGAGQGWTEARTAWQRSRETGH